MAAFFARVKGKKGPGEKENLVLTSNGGEVTHLRTKKQVGPCALDAKPLPADFTGDRRDALAEWLASDQNPYFSRSIINRIWRHYFGKGMVEPVDDLRLTNPPMNGELFDWLAKDLVAHKYDLRHLMKSILLSQTYQRSAEPVKGNER